MPMRFFIIEIVKGVEIHVFFETVQGLLVRFVVKLVHKYRDKFYEIIRFESAHNCPHKDILDIDGSVKRKVWFEMLDNKQALDMAIQDLKDNYEMYLERYEKWLKK